jgi:hypothetical protein
MDMPIVSEFVSKDGNTRLKIYPEECPETPREWDNVGTMICFHKSYELGDTPDTKKYSKGGFPSIDPEDFEGWADMEEYIINTLKAEVVFSLYLYDHSGVTISTTPFSCPWDSGQVGFIYCTREDILYYFGGKKLTEKSLNQAKQCLLGEVETYDQYLTGQVYGFVVEQKIDPCDKCGRPARWEDTDSCWGFYGNDEEVETQVFDHAGLNRAEFEEI